MEEWNKDLAPSIYKPLPTKESLRLLVIQPGEHADPLRTELIPITLDEARGCYDAASYTWGSPENPALIACGDAKLWVQRNAFDMMRDLRKPDQPRTVWIDAVCVNQCEREEREEQVAIFHHIYRGARSTWVWLGRPDGYSSVAMAYAARLDAGKFLREFSHCRMPANWADKSYFFDPSFNAGIDASRLRQLAVAIVEFLNRPWFSRVWIQQEASLCRDVQVMCGPDVIGWDSLLALAWVMCPRYTETWPDYVNGRLIQTINNIQAVRIIQNARQYYFQDVYGSSNFVPGFERMVESVSRYQATDPRDRIYAMGHIIADTYQWFKADYKVPWEVLYADVARRFLDAGALRFLKNAGRVRQEANTVLPSWVPDYRYKEESRYMISTPTVWKAGGHSQMAFIPPGNRKAPASKVSPLPKGRERQFVMSDELKAYKGPNKSLLQSFASFRCLMSDEIVYVGDFVDNEDGYYQDNIQRIVDSIKKDINYIATLTGPTYINGEDLFDAYKLTLIMSCDDRQELVNSDYVRRHWEEWFTWYEQGSPGYWDANVKKPVLNATFESSGAIKTFRFAVTKHGYFCLVPRIVQAGDEIAIFQPYELAVVIRRLPPSLPPQGQDQKLMLARMEPYFELLGDAYVHGMMENEARCISDEFDCRYEPTQAQWEKILKASDEGRGKAWTTLSLDGQYERILKTLGLRTVHLV